MKRVIRASVADSEDGSSTSSRRSSRFMVVDFTYDEIAHKTFNNHQNPPPQDFYHLKQRCLSENTLFEDSDFPPTHASLIKDGSSPDPSVQWLRPGQICRKPKFFVEGVSRFDVRQGSLNDCWLLTATANLTANQRIFRKTVPLDNSFEEDEYAGIFHFRFWQFGQWVDVVIDDRLPTKDRRLIFMSSSQKNEFWSALLEKAYAKLYGSYGALNGGTAREAMQDFTGGITESYRLRGKEPPPENLFEIIQSGFQRGSMFACNILPDPKIPEARTPQGLLKGHSYSITKTHLFGQNQLIRLRNPWGDGVEWNGPWSDHSKEWDAIPKSQRKQLGLTIDEDGEFWMSFQDFLRYFDRVEICNLSPDPLDDNEAGSNATRGWQVSTIDGEWVQGSTAGGCVDFLDTFWTNPQYVIRLDQPDRDDKSGMCTVVVALLQKYRRVEDLASMTIGFMIYRITEEDLRNKPIPMKFFKKNEYRIVARSIFINSREVSCRLKLNPGLYLIIPSTLQPNEEGEFLVRIFSELRNCLEENDCTVCFGTMDDRVSGPLLENKDWEQMVRTFYEMADRKGEIDHVALSSILSQFFFSPKTKSTKSSRSFWKSICLTLQIFLLCRWMPFPVPTKSTQSNRSTNRSLVQQISKLLIARVNPNKSTRLNYDQFKTIVRDVQQWQAVFKLYDLDASGHLDRKELKRALNSSGFNVNNRVTNSLLKRSHERGMDHMEFVDFVLCAVESRNAIELHQNIEETANQIFTEKKTN